MTSYMTLVGGPTPVMVREGDRWVEKIREMHIILLDNGRLKAAKDGKFKQIFQCVRCASCLNVCPVYTLVGGHVYGGHTYAGGIGAILTAFLSGMADFEKFHELCIGCRRCTEVCPGKIDIPGLIEELRVRAVEAYGLPFVVKQLFDNVIINRKVFHGLLRAASLGMKPFAKGNLIRHLPLSSPPGKGPKPADHCRETSAGSHAGAFAQARQARRPSCFLLRLHDGFRPARHWEPR